MAKQQTIGRRGADANILRYYETLNSAINCYNNNDVRDAIDPVNRAVVLKPESIHAMVWKAIILNAHHPHREDDVKVTLGKVLLREECAESPKTAEDYIGLTLLYSTDKLTNMGINPQPEKAAEYAKEARRLDSSLAERYLSSPTPESVVTNVSDRGGVAQPAPLQSLKF